jgi:acetyl esterase
MADVPPADVKVRDQRVPRTAPVSGTIGIRVYRPHGPGLLPIVVYYHGGGFVLGDLDGYDRVCRRLCADAQVVVVSVDYRLAPEHPFPAPVEDAWVALCWIAEHAVEWNADAERLAVAGDSAGGTLAAVMALMARDAGGPRIAFQALVYPATALGVDGPYSSRTQHAQGPTLTWRTTQYFNAHYFGATGKATDFRGAPILARDLTGLPPALVQVAGHDLLRDEILDYAGRMLQAGTDAMVVEYRGLAHGFLSMGGALPAARLAQLQLAQALQAGLS